MSDRNTQMYVGIAVALVIIGAAAMYFRAPAPEVSETFKVGMVTGTGGLGDKSFNDIAFSGIMQALEDYDIEYDVVEPTAVSEYEGYQRDFAMSEEYGLIICIGFDQADALTIVAEEYPEQKFALVDMVVENENVASMTFRANEGSFLLGVVAAMESETGKIGFVGGVPIPLIVDFYVGYKAGAEWAVPGIEVLEPVYVGGFGDPATGKELAVSLIEGGADMIYSAAGGSGLGALEAADEEAVTGLGVDACQDYLNDHMLASMTKRVDTAVYDMIVAAYNDEFQGGFTNGGLAEGWVGMCRLPDEEAYWEELFDFHHPTLPSDVVDKVEEAKAGILSGDIVVPNGYQ